LEIGLHLAAFAGCFFEMQTILKAASAVFRSLRKIFLKQKKKKVFDFFSLKISLSKEPLQTDFGFYRWF